jgi:hypothetical protein
MALVRRRRHTSRPVQIFDQQGRRPVGTVTLGKVANGVYEFALGAVTKEFSMPDKPAGASLHKEPVSVHTVNVTYRYQVRVIAIVEIRRHVEVVAPNADEAFWMVEAMIDATAKNLDFLLHRSSNN